MKHREIFNRCASGPQFEPEEAEPSVYDGIPDNIWAREEPEDEDEE
jgi:hypothetical protein